MNEDKKMTKEGAVEISLLLSLLAGSGAKGNPDPQAYKNAVVETFTAMLDGLGFEVVEKPQ